MGRAAFTQHQTFREKSHSIQGTKGWVNQTGLNMLAKTESLSLLGITYAPAIKMPGSLPVQQKTDVT
jgi:hypothetical protein